jgi:hypothetical protein
MKNGQLCSILIVCVLETVFACSSEGSSDTSVGSGGSNGGSNATGGSGGKGGTAGTAGSSGSSAGNAGSGPVGGAGGAQAAGGSGGGGAATCPDHPPRLPDYPYTPEACTAQQLTLQCTYDVAVPDAGVCPTTFSCQCLSDHMGGVQCNWLGALGVCLDGGS